MLEISNSMNKMVLEIFVRDICQSPISRPSVPVKIACRVTSHKSSVGVFIYIYIVWQNCLKFEYPISHGVLFINYWWKNVNVICCRKNILFDGLDLGWPYRSIQSTLSWDHLKIEVYFMDTSILSKWWFSWLGSMLLWRIMK